MKLPPEYWTMDKLVQRGPIDDRLRCGVKVRHALYGEGTILSKQRNLDGKYWYAVLFKDPALSTNSLITSELLTQA